MEKFLRQALVGVALLFLSSCANVSKVQPKIVNLAATQQFEYALKTLDRDSRHYGENNALLYLLDKGLLLHYARQYQESITVFEQARQKYEELYTQSVSRMAGSLLWNDATLPYQAEDFERVLINIFQALNYLMLDNPDEALVEARDVDSTLSAINAQYQSDQKNVYKEDAFARFLMGILYEQGKSFSRINDAFISYQKAFEIYENDYASLYNLSSPELLKENLLSTAAVIDPVAYKKYRRKFPATASLPFNKNKTTSEVYLLQYSGFSPIKVEDSIPLPLPDGHIVRLSFPRYQKKYFKDKHNYFIAKAKTGKVVTTELELGQDIEAIAIKNLGDRKARIIAKSVARSAGKYFFTKNQVEKVREKHGKKMERLVLIASNLYAYFSEQADLRSWQTLPAHINIARLILEPGEYDLFFNSALLSFVSLEAGERRFFIVR